MGIADVSTELLEQQWLAGVIAFSSQPCVDHLLDVIMTHATSPCSSTWSLDRAHALHLRNAWLENQQKHEGLTGDHAIASDPLGKRRQSCVPSIDDVAHKLYGMGVCALVS